MVECLKIFAYSFSNYYLYVKDPYFFVIVNEKLLIIYSEFTKKDMSGLENPTDTFCQNGNEFKEVSSDIRVSTLSHNEFSNGTTHSSSRAASPTTMTSFADSQTVDFNEHEMEDILVNI